MADQPSETFAILLIFPLLQDLVMTVPHKRGLCTLMHKHWRVRHTQIHVSICGCLQQISVEGPFLLTLLYSQNSILFQLKQATLINRCPPLIPKEVRKFGTFGPAEISAQGLTWIQSWGWSSLLDYKHFIQGKGPYLLAMYYSTDTEKSLTVSVFLGKLPFSGYVNGVSAVHQLALMLPFWQGSVPQPLACVHPLVLSVIFRPWHGLSFCVLTETRSLAGTLCFPG